MYMWASKTKPGLSRKMELAIPLDRVDVYLSFSERIIHLPHVYQKLCLIEFRI